MSKKPDDRPPAIYQPPPIVQPMIDELKGQPKPSEDLGAPKPAPPEAVVDTDASQNPDPDCPET